MTDWPRTLEDALAAIPSYMTPQIELGCNLLSPGQKMIYLRYTDPINPRRKAVDILPGPLLGDSIPDMLRMLAGAFERAEEMAAENAEPDGFEQPGA